MVVITVAEGVDGDDTDDTDDSVAGMGMDDPSFTHILIRLSSLIPLSMMQLACIIQSLENSCA